MTTTLNMTAAWLRAGDTIRHHGDVMAVTATQGMGLRVIVTCDDRRFSFSPSQRIEVVR